MFADDILLFSTGTKQQFGRIFCILNEFAAHSDCKLKMSKCQGFHVEANRDDIDKPYSGKGLQWPSEVFRYLGILVPIQSCNKCSKSLFELNMQMLWIKLKLF